MPVPFLVPHICSRIPYVELHHYKVNSFAGYTIAPLQHSYSVKPFSIAGIPNISGLSACARDFQRQREVITGGLLRLRALCGSSTIAQARAKVKCGGPVRAQP